MIDNSLADGRNSSQLAAANRSRDLSTDKRATCWPDSGNNGAMIIICILQEHFSASQVDVANRLSRERAPAGTISGQTHGVRVESLGKVSPDWQLLIPSPRSKSSRPSRLPRVSLAFSARPSSLLGPPFSLASWPLPLWRALICPLPSTGCQSGGREQVFVLSLSLLAQLALAQLLDAQSSGWLRRTWSQHRQQMALRSASRRAGVLCPERPD